jgi:mRNA-degrading endonuclease RelE of RelBE toxin-antitoxin system
LSYGLRLSARAERCYSRLSRPEQERVTRRIDQLLEDPYGGFTKQLRGESGTRSARVGDLRILYQVDDDELIVEVREIGPRGQVYRRL